jgi:demethylmenaquinone methyltransferase/2-methoxy-6-polyprenyl-1,4-benzoquinol methylase
MLGLAPGQTILDWGCGTCLALDPITKAGATYIGLDFSFGMLSARKGRPEGHVVLGDCTKLPFRSGSFDGVLGATVIQNIRRRRMALLEISRVLKEGGRAALSFPKKTKVSIRGFATLGLTRTRTVPCAEDLALCLEKRAA